MAARYTSNAPQTVGALQNVLFLDTTCAGNCSILHRGGSGLITLRGLTNGQCRARFHVAFGGNIAIPTGGTVAPISIAIAINGEADNSTLMIVTPAAVEDLWNVSSQTYIDVPAGCCIQVSIKNMSAEPIIVQNANFEIERVA